MIRLADSVFYNPDLPFMQQDDEVKELITQHYYDNARLLPPLGLEGSRYEWDGGYTLYDNYNRPIEVCVQLGSIAITASRVYIDQSSAWRLHQEVITIKISEP